MEHFEIDRTDEEREEQVKQWIKDYWLLVVFAVGAAIAAVYGLNYYKQSKIDALSEVASQVNQVSAKLKSGDLSGAVDLVHKLQENEASSSFSAVATLSLAQKYFDNKEYQSAAQNYEWVIANAGDIAMRDVARLRKARVEANNQKIQAAVDTLSNIEGSESIAEANLLKGDILLAAKDFEAAKKAYQSIPTAQNVNAELVKQRLELIDIKQQL